MDDEIITVVDAIEPSIDWEKFYSSRIPDEEFNASKSILDAGRESYEKLDEIESPRALESAVNDIDPVFGKGWTDYMKSILMTFMIDWQDKHTEEEENEIFFPEDLLRIMFLLTKKISDQKTTIENLIFALEHLKKNNV